MNRVHAVHQRVGRRGWRAAFAAAVVLAASTAQATSYDEGTMGDLSDNSASPTLLLSSLTPGANHIVGSTIPSGPIIDATGARAAQDNDYVSFTVPTGFALVAIDSILTQPTVPIPGSPSVSGDRAFVGISRGVGVFLTGVNGPATGLLGWTLPGVASTPSLQDILPALGASDPDHFPVAMFSGATRFTGPLGAGSYTLWLLDGDSPLLYDLNLVVAAVPEPPIWLLMIMGVGSFVAERARRARRRAAVASIGSSPVMG